MSTIEVLFGRMRRRRDLLLEVDVRGARRRVLMPTQYLKERERLIVENVELRHGGWVSGRDRAGVLRDHPDLQDLES